VTVYRNLPAHDTDRPDRKIDSDAIMTNSQETTPNEQDHQHDHKQSEPQRGRCIFTDLHQTCVR